MSEVKVNKISPRSGTAVTLGDSGDKFTVPSGSNITINSGASITNDGTATGFDTDTNDKVKVSANDTTPGFLNGKLVAGTNITLTEGSDGGNETLTAALSGTIPTARLGTGTADATTFLRGDQTYASATPADGSITTAQLAYNPNPFRNIIINGDMSLAQRGTSVSGITNFSEDVFVADRFCWTENGSMTSTFTMSQVTDVPASQGFAKSLKVDCTATDTPATNERIRIETRFEGQNLQYLKKGTANAESWTISFWVKSSKTGTYIVNFLDEDNARMVSKAYTVSSASTWEKKIITVAPDTTGQFNNDNGHSLTVAWILSAGPSLQSGPLADVWQAYANANYAAGQVNFADSTSNELYLTGVQLEAGTTASDFEFLPVDVNLARCQRYFYMHAQGSGDELGIGCYYSSSQIALDFQFPVTMRTAPSVYQTTGTDYFATYRPGVADGFNSLTAGSATTTMFGLYNNSEVSGTAQDAQFFRTANGSAKLGADAEL